MIDGKNNVIPPAGGEAVGHRHGVVRIRPSVPANDAAEVSGGVEGSSNNTGHPGLEGAAADMGATLNQVRAELHERMRSGFYESDEVLGSIAARMLDLFGL